MIPDDPNRAFHRVQRDFRITAEIRKDSSLTSCVDRSLGREFADIEEITGFAIFPAFNSAIGHFVVKRLEAVVCFRIKFDLVLFRDAGLNTAFVLGNQFGDAGQECVKRCRGFC